MGENFDGIKIYDSKIDLGGRLSAQKGVFTKLLSWQWENINKKFYEDTGHFKDENIIPPVTKIMIDSNLRKPIMEYLLSNNINGNTIFPDFFGAIQSIHLELNSILEYQSLR